MVFGRKSKKELEEMRQQVLLQEQTQRYNELQLQAQKELMEQRMRQQQEDYERKVQQDREEHDRQMRQWEFERQERERYEYEQEKRKQELKRVQDLKKLQQKKLEQIRQERLRRTTPEALREVRNLIRTRYELDTLIWSLRGSRIPDRPFVQEKMDKADAVLQQIITMVDSWEKSEKVWTDEEWILAQRIKAMIDEKGKRWWAEQPPWNEK
jgi:hypothetical protein